MKTGPARTVVRIAGKDFRLMLAPSRLVGTVRTVLGGISPEMLGTTLMHEHILLHVGGWFTEPSDEKRWLVDAKVTPQLRAQLMEDPTVCKDNLILNDVVTAEQEVSFFQVVSGSAIVDQTCIGMGRDIGKLGGISSRTGVHVVTSTGWYIHPFHTSTVSKADADTLAAVMERELKDGIDGTGVKAGIIGEIGCTYPLHESEIKVLKAAGLAQSRTGAPVSIHPGGFDHQKNNRPKEGLRYLDIVLSGGGDPDRFILSHSDNALDFEYYQELLDRGVTLSFDGFGQEFTYGTLYSGLRNPSDASRVAAVADLCKKGYEKQLVLSQDVWLKIQLDRYGGGGYAHILKNIVPALIEAGVSRAQLESMLVENPRSLLSF